MKSQLQPGEPACDRCPNRASVHHHDGRKYCLLHDRIDKDTYLAIQALTREGLI